MTIGELIRRSRLSANLTQKELGARLGVAYQTVAQWENGFRNPKFSTLQKIADALSINVLSLIPEKEPVKTGPFWIVDLEAKLKSVDCLYGFDEDNAAMYIHFPDGLLEVTDEDLKELNEATDSFMRFKLDELRQRHPNDFRPLGIRAKGKTDDTKK